MSTALCVVFESPVGTYGTLGGDNLALLKQQSQLDRIAHDAGLTPLSRFESFDVTEAAAEFDIDPPEDAPPVSWFAAAEGLTAVRALIAYLRSNPDSLRGQDQVMNELTTVESELNAAAQISARFRFSVVS